MYKLELITRVRTIDSSYSISVLNRLTVTELQQLIISLNKGVK